MAYVVSAASLLAVLADRSTRLQMLFNAVLPEGALLIIKPTRRMNLTNARAYAKKYRIKNSF
jgi:hypothetical protein